MTATNTTDNPRATTLISECLQAHVGVKVSLECTARKQDFAFAGTLYMAGTDAGLWGVQVSPELKIEFSKSIVKNMAVSVEESPPTIIEIEAP